MSLHSSPKKSVYLETSFFSFLCDDRPTAAIVARRQWTERWWNLHRHNYALVTGAAVLSELERGNLPHRQRAHEIGSALPAVPVSSEASAVAAFYVAHRLMPNDPQGDGMHLALASVNNCDFLLTWNCRNLANANKFGHIRRVNVILGLHVPALVTPLELMGVSADETE